jgi:hypothetical protein
VQQKAAVKRAHLDAMEKVLKEEQAIIGQLNQMTQELLKKTKETRAEADARVSACAKLQEDLDWHVGAVSQQELAVPKRELELLEKEEENARKHERESSELKSRADDLSTHEATLEAEQECMRKTCEDLCNREFTISSQEGTLERRTIALTFKERELANKEKWLVEIGLQELATMCKMVEELQAARAIEVHKIWDFLGKTKMVLVPLGFSSVQSGEPAWEVSTVLPVLDFIGAKMLTLEEVVGEQLEAEGRVLAKKVAEHMLMCF